MSDQASRKQVETTLLSIMLGNEAARYELADRLVPEQFRSAGHRTIFEVMRSYAIAGKAFDEAVLCERFYSAGQRDVVAIVVELNGYAASHEWEHFAAILDNMHRQDRLGDMAKWLTEAHKNDETKETIDEAEARLAAISTGIVEHEASSIGEIAGECIALTAERKAAGGVEVIGARTGYVLLDRCLLGFQPEKFYVLAARPRVGKSALMASTALRLAKNGSPQAIISCEMGRRELGYRLLAIESGVDKYRIKLGTLREDEMECVQRAGARLRSLPLDICFAPGIRPSEIRSRCRRLKGSMGLQGVWVDYIQIMRCNADVKPQSREQEVASISREMKNIGGDLGISVTGLAQLNRQLEHRKDKEPTLSDLRESGAIENDADVVMFIHREVDDECPNDPTPASLIVAKHRDGSTGVFKMVYIPTRTEFAEEQGA